MNKTREERTRRPRLCVSDDDDGVENDVAKEKKPLRRPSIDDESDEHSEFCESRTQRRLSIGDNEEERSDKAVKSKHRPSLDNLDVDLTVEDTTDEIQYLKSQGILPKDFPSVITGDYEKYDDADLAEEIKVLRAKGVITEEDAELMRRNWQSSLRSAKLLDCRSCRISIPSFDNNGIPVNWTNCDKHSKIHKLVKLKPGLDIPVYDLIEQKFCKVNIGIKKIERLENVRQLRRFKSESEEIQNHRSPGFDLNIQYLYHGTDVEKERICEEGLDQRLSRMGYFGKGIYFSDNPLKCVHYSEDCSSPNEAYILMCRVILGTAKVYPAGCYDTTLKREPEKEDQSDGWRYYDSVMGCPKDFNEYVVYENRRAMIEYIITFTIDEHLANQIRERSSGGSSKMKDSFKRQCSVEDDHFQKISEVRENVRRKRMQEKGLSYSQPSEHQQEQDEEMWHQLQKLRLNQTETIATYSQVSAEPVVFSDLHGDSCYGSSSLPRSPDSYKAEITGLAHEIEDSGSDVEATGSDVKEINPVDQVLSSCMAEFMAVTDCEDSCIARHYVQKALQDVNLAITLYYEDM